MAEGIEITPQSNFVFVDETGRCSWEPRYENSVTQCPVDVTWFPFDEQECELAFKSWTLTESTLKLHTNESWIYLTTFLQPDAWHVLGITSSAIAERPRGARVFEKFAVAQRRSYLHYIV